VARLFYRTRVVLDIYHNAELDLDNEDLGQILDHDFRYGKDHNGPPVLVSPSVESYGGRETTYLPPSEFARIVIDLDGGDPLDCEAIRVFDLADVAASLN
jgi:hypothetical protein